MKIREDFTKKFGYICHEMCNGGRLSYNRYVDEGSGEIKGYNIDHLTKQELYDLMKKSVETGVDHLYEAVKDNEDVLPFYPEELYIENMQEKFPNLNINELL